MWVNFSHWAIDFNDNVAPTGQAELLEYGTCQQHFMDRPRKVSFVPRIKIGGTDVVTPSIVPVMEMAPQWLSTDQAKIGHYGLKWAFSPTLQQVDTVVNVYIEVAGYCSTARRAKRRKPTSRTRPE